MPRPLIAVFRGGYSGESVISHQSALRMLQAVDTDRYEPLFITLTRERWTCEGPDGASVPFDRGDLSVDRGSGREGFSAALIAIHGPPGEDGTLQGYLDMLDVPYQTGGVLNMALTFSKHSTTALLREMGFEVAPSVILRLADADAAERVATIGYPCFVKPDRSGSSLGVSKVKQPGDLTVALQAAFAECAAVMVEGAVSGRELTCGVIRLNGSVKAMPVCEIRTSREFFDYEAKYHSTDTQELVPAPLPDEVTQLVQQRSVAIYRALDCNGMARVDHFWTGDRLVTIEVNTTPGFSGASIFPKMLEVEGTGVPAAINGLLEGMLQR
ncbi:MAG: D-alanine--D-alanine ligase family protein [Flavobacteriales bacterium]